MGLDGTGGSRLARHDMTLEEHAEEDSVDCMIYPNVMFRVQLIGDSLLLRKLVYVSLQAADTGSDSSKNAQDKQTD